jgi:hypothetical protein
VTNIEKIYTGHVTTEEENALGYPSDGPCVPTSKRNMLKSLSSSSNCTSPSKPANKQQRRKLEDKFKASSAFIHGTTCNKVPIIELWDT